MYLSVGSVVKKYKIVLELKQGVQGLVFVVEEVKTRGKFALKSMVVDEKKKEEFEKMVKTWKILCKSKAKDYVVSYVEHFYEGKNVIIIMEYCSGGDLETLIQKRNLENVKFSESDVMKMLIETMSALEEMRLLDFIHRDIKAANILIGEDGKHKLCDFNTSKNLEGKSGTATMAGTLEYTPPEVVNAENYSFPVDVYSIGIVAYQMIVGKTPYAKVGGVAMMDLMLGRYAPISTNLGYSVPLASLIHSCISMDPSKRPTPADVLASPLVLREQEAAVRRAVAGVEETVQAIQRRLETTGREMEEWKMKAIETGKMVEEWKGKGIETKKEVEEWKGKAIETRKEVEELHRVICQMKKDIESFKVKGYGSATLGVTATAAAATTIATVASPAAGPSDSNLRVIAGWLGSSKTFTLLYRASRDGFSGESFHGKCDNKGRTVTIITSSNDYVFGGYAAVAWSNNPDIIADDSGTSFLFSLKNPRNALPEKFSLLEKKDAIRGGASYGLAFGFSTQIYCSYDSNSNKWSYASLDGSDTYSKPAGLSEDMAFTDGGYFTAKEIEVYQVK